MSTATDRANELFLRAALSDGDLNYPERVAFIAEDEPGVHRALVANLLEGVPTVIVNAAGGERLLLPVRRPGLVGAVLRIVDRLLGRIPVVALSRGVTSTIPASYATLSTVRRTERRGRTDRPHAPAHG